MILQQLCLWNVCLTPQIQTSSAIWRPGQKLPVESQILIQFGSLEQKQNYEINIVIHLSNSIEILILDAIHLINDKILDLTFIIV